MDVDKFDAIVIGVGGHGSSALYHLAKRGQKVFVKPLFALTLLRLENSSWITLWSASPHFTVKIPKNQLWSTVLCQLIVL